MNNVMSVNEIVSARNLVVMTRGLEKVGKSRLGYTMPKPLFVACLDKPPDKTVQRFGKIDYKMYMPVRDPSRPVEEIVEENLAILSEFRADLSEMLTYPSIMFDSASSLWKLVRLAELGSEVKVMPREYYAPNTIMDNLLSSLHSKSRNVLFTTKLKDKYVEKMVGNKLTSSATGEMLPDTWRDLAFQVHVNLTQTRDNTDPYTFRSTVIDSSINGQLKGIELTDDDINWDMLLDLHYE